MSTRILGPKQSPRLQPAVEIAALPAQEEKRALWRKLNGRRPDRPMVMIDQVCWNEMNVDDELTPRCRDAECRGDYVYSRKQEPPGRE